MLAHKLHNAPSAAIEYLKKVSLFKDLVAIPGAVEGFAGVMTEKTYKTGDTIITEGETGPEMFFLTQGKVTVLKNTPDGELFKVAILDGSQHVFFGEGSLITADTRSATIRAETEVTCLILDASHFAELCVQHPDWGLPFFRQIAAGVLHRLKKTNTDLMTLYKALVAEVRGH